MADKSPYPDDTAERARLNDHECERLARPIGSGFRYATLYLDEPQRRAISAIKALDVTLDDISRTIAEPSVARAKLDWWISALFRMSQEAPDHPITQSLLGALNELNCAVSTLVPALEERLGGAQLELDYQGFETRADTQAYLEATGGAVFELFARILVVPEAQRATWRQLGAIHRRITRLQYLGRDVRGGFIYIPREQLTSHDLAEADLYRPEAPATTRKLIEAEWTDLHAQRSRILAALAAGTPKPARFLRALIALDDDRLRLMHRDDLRMLERRPDRSAFRKLLIAWWAGKRPLQSR